MGISFNVKIVDNPAYKFFITSNGLDGEKYTYDSFNISKTKFSNVEIPFVIKIKDIDGFSIKNYNKIPLSSLNITLSAIGDIQLLDENGNSILDEYGEDIYGSGIIYTIPQSSYSLKSLNDETLDESQGGFFRGSIIFNTLRFPLTNISINVSGNVMSDQLSTYTLTAQSNSFNVYNKSHYDIFKKNENFSASETLKGLIFQETLLDKDKLFDNFFGAILGNSEYGHDDMGTKIYEKISNFCKNTQDVDVCEIDFLKSISQYVDYNDIGEEKYNYPESLKRLLNLNSINKQYLVGELNKFDENFDIKGRSSKLEFGRNIGNVINPINYIVDSQKPIVALEKFSNTYKKINTYQPSVGLSASQYPLSAYSDDWGWPLVLPADFVIHDMSKYYIFFEYIEDSDNTPVGGIIDYTNSKTNIGRELTYSELYNDDGVFDNMILDTLYQNLSMIK